MNTGVMKKAKSEDNLLWKSQVNRDAGNDESVEFWDLLYPEHPMIKLFPILEASPEDEVLCLGCGKVHNSHGTNTDCSQITSDQSAN